MYAAVVSTALVAGLVAAGAALPSADTDAPKPVRVVTCTQTATLSNYPSMDAAERHSCQSTYTPYVGLPAGR